MLTLCFVTENYFKKRYLLVLVVLVSASNLELDTNSDCSRVL